MREIEFVRIAAGAAAWGSLAFVAFVTLSPLELRPVVGGLGFEHIGAFAIVGMLFGIAYPKKMPTIMIVIAVAAISLEAAQHLVPGRHGRAVDLIAKLFGGGIGVATAAVSNAWLRTRTYPR